MSSIDERVVQMKFNNSQFESGIKQTTDSLDKLKKGLDLKGAGDSLNELDAAGKRFSLAGIAAGVDTLVSRFSALGIIGITALANITNSAVNAGRALVSSLTVDPIKQGLAEYETNLNAIQTILANTQSKGSTLDDVNAALQELNTYSDKTIYNFSEMARNIGTFTAAGVDLGTSVAAIKGIANLAALSGSNSEQASTAMYQLSQALATGTVKLMDWNSVVNAGMGGQVFQDAIKETARVHGVAVDDIIKEEGSFRDSLQKGWLTADILNETLSRFTGDLNAEQLKTLGYSDEQIKASMQLGKTASEAATKVKTASQLIGTLQEAVGSGWTQSWQLVFGDFEEARTMWTNVNNVLGGMIGQSANARNKILGDWKELGGRTALLDAIKYAWQDIMGVLTPVQEAFRHIFPPMTGKMLADMTKNVRDFFASLKMGGADSNNLRRTFQGVFAVFDIGWQVIQKVAGVLFRLLGFATKGSGSFLEFTAKIGDWLTKLDEAIKKGDKLNGFFTGLEKVLKIPIAALQFLGGLVKSFFETMGNAHPLKAFGLGVETAFNTLKQRFDVIAQFGNWVSTVFKAIMGFFREVFKAFKPVAKAFGDFFSGLGDQIANSVKTGDFSGIFQVLNTGLFAALVIALRKFFKKGLNINFGGGLVDSIKGVFGALTDTLGALQGQIKAKTLMSIAIAVGVLTVSVVALSLIDPVRLTTALGGITIMFGQLVGAMTLLEKINSKLGAAKLIAMTFGMILFAGAIDLMAVAVAKLAKLDWNGIAKGLTAVTVIMAEMVGVSKLMGDPKKMISTSVGMIALGVALNVIASAVAKFADLSWEELGRGLTGVAGGLIGLVGAMRLMPKSSSFTGGAALAAAAGAILILSKAMKTFGNMSWESLLKSLVALGGALLAMSLSLKLMSDPAALAGAGALVIASAAVLILGKAFAQLAKLSWDDIGRIMATIGAGLAILAVATALVSAPVFLIGAANLIIISVAMNILAAAFKKFAKLSWDDFGKVMAYMGTGLAILAVGLTLMLVALPGAIALQVAAGALIVLGAAFKVFASLSWEDLGKSLLALGASLYIIAFAGVALLPAIPGLIGLGIAAALIGVGALAAGIGLLAFSVGLTAIAISGAVGTAALIAMVAAFIGLIPQLATGLAAGVVAFAQGLAASGTALMTASVALMLAFLQGLQQVSPQINATLAQMLLDFLNTVAANIQPYTDAGMRILLGFLQGIEDHISEVIDKGTQIIVKFIEGIQQSSNDIVNAAADAITAFMNGLATTIETKSGEMRDAGLRIAGAIVDGMTGGLAGKAWRIAEAAGKLVAGIPDTIKRLLGINSPSRVTTELGEWTGEGVAVGMDNKAGRVEDSAHGLGVAAVNAMKSTMSQIANAVSTDVNSTPVIRPVLDMTSFKKDAGTIGSYFQTPTLSLDNSYNQAASVAVQERENQAYLSSEDDNTPDGRGGVNFYQYNTSPKALSAPELYRQTKNQVSLAKEVLAI